MYFVRPNHAHTNSEDGFNKLELTIAIDPEDPNQDYGNAAWHMLLAIMHELTEGMFADVTSPTKVDEPYGKSYDIPQTHDGIPVVLSVVVVLNSSLDPYVLDRKIDDMLRRAFSRAILATDGLLANA